MKKSFPIFRKSESGAILIIVAAFMGLMITLATFAMDSYMKLQARAEQQNVAEYFAIAALGSFVKNFESGSSVDPCSTGFTDAASLDPQNSIFGYKEHGFDLQSTSNCESGTFRVNVAGSEKTFDLKFGVVDDAGVFVATGPGTENQINAAHVSLATNDNNILKFFSETTGTAYMPASAMAVVTEMNGRRQIRLAKYAVSGDSLGYEPPPAAPVSPTPTPVPSPSATPTPSPTATPTPTPSPTSSPDPSPTATPTSGPYCDGHQVYIDGGSTVLNCSTSSCSNSPGSPDSFYIDGFYRDPNSGELFGDPLPCLQTALSQAAVNCGDMEPGPSTWSIVGNYNSVSVGSLIGVDHACYKQALIDSFGQGEILGGNNNIYLDSNCNLAARPNSGLGYCSSMRLFNNDNPDPSPTPTPSPSECASDAYRLIVSGNWTYADPNMIPEYAAYEIFSDAFSGVDGRPNGPANYSQCLNNIMDNVQSVCGQSTAYPYPNTYQSPQGASECYLNQFLSAIGGGTYPSSNQWGGASAYYIDASCNPITPVNESEICQAFAMFPFGNPHPRATPTPTPTPAPQPAYRYSQWVCPNFSGQGTAEMVTTDPAEFNSWNNSGNYPIFISMPEIDTNYAYEATGATCHSGGSRNSGAPDAWTCSADYLPDGQSIYTLANPAGCYCMSCVNNLPRCRRWDWSSGEPPTAVYNNPSGYASYCDDTPTVSPTPTPTPTPQPTPIGAFPYYRVNFIFAKENYSQLSPEGFAHYYVGAPGQLPCMIQILNNAYNNCGPYSLDADGFNQIHDQKGLCYRNFISSSLGYNLPPPDYSLAPYHPSVNSYNEVNIDKFCQPIVPSPEDLAAGAGAYSLVLWFRAAE